MRLLISACLLGCCCRYDGASKPHPLAEALAQRHTLVPVCPEQMGDCLRPARLLSGMENRWSPGRAGM